MNAKDWYLAKFPEALYPCNDLLLKEYQDKVIAGRGLMARSTACICGIARNVAVALPNTLARIEKLRDMFQLADVVIYENDSTDGTDKILLEWEENARIYPATVVITAKTDSTIHAKDQSLARRIAMAKARNQYLKYVRRTGVEFDYIVIVDMDLDGGWSYEGVANSFGWHEIWDGIGSNGLVYELLESGMRRLFFDSWAFRRLNHPQPHDSAEINLLSYNRGEAPIRVDSAFGGLAIYKGECITKTKFEYKDDDCDHPTLNRQLAEIGKTIWLNPSMITLYSPTEYTSFTH